jgi:hypothetical protein
MHVGNDLLEIVTVDDREYEEIVEEYEEEILVPKGVLEPPVTDSVSDTVPAQGKPQCMTRIFDNHDIYVVHLRCRNFMIRTCIYIPMSLTSVGSRSCFA